MLVLLVIFMITAPMLTQGVTVDLPKIASEAIQSTESEPLIVSVDSSGLYYLNTASAPDMPLDPQALQIQVAARLTLAREEGKAMPVLVKGDQGVSYGKVIEAMAVLKHAGADKVGLVTDSPAETEEHQA
jgi:biopolymer transport protein TolR